MNNTYFKTIAYLALAGTLFAGYLSFMKLLTSTCAFNESCPYFLGYPACWYGFGMFLIMLVLSITGLYKKNKRETLRRSIILVSFVGILFAGRLVLPELKLLFSNDAPSYAMILPSCAYGLLFYVIIFILSLRAPKQ